MRTHHLFISHSWSYSDQYDRLVRLLRNRSYFRFSNYSVPQDDPIHNAPNDRALREAIRRKMGPCGVVLVLAGVYSVLAGVYSTYSRWIDIELQLASAGFASPKPIIAIEPWGSERTSRRVKRVADRVVGWNTESVVRAIRELD